MLSIKSLSVITLAPRFLVAWFVTAALSGCSATTADECIAFKPIRPQPSDLQVVSDDMVKQLLIHNETGKSICGWKP